MPTLIGLHGFTGTPASWDAVRAALPAGVRLWCPEIVGHDGGAIRTATFDAEVDRLAGEIRALGAGRVHLAGYSQGGRLALGLLLRQPSLFAAATLVGASPGLEDASARAARRAADERLARRLEEDGLEPFLEHWESLPLFASQSALPAAVRHAQRSERRRHRPEGLARALRAIGTGAMPDLWPRLAEIEVPIRLMAGELDTKFVTLAHRMVERLPHAEVEIVAGAGHNLLLEAPRRVAACLAEKVSIMIP